MFCLKCASESPSTSGFCDWCGAVLSPTPPSGGLVEPDRIQDAMLAASLPLPEPPPPVALFAMEVLGLSLLGSYLALNFADDWARGHWRSTSGTIVAGAASMWLLWRVRKVWQVLGESGQGIAYRKKLLVRGMVFAILFLVAAAVIGQGIGQNGKETARMVKDLEERSQLIQKIGEQRTASARTIPALVEAYKQMEPDLAEWNAVLLRLQLELQAYDAKSPEAHDGTAKTIRYVEFNLQQASLIKQEIEVAKAIELLDPATQAIAWQEKMDPLLNQEEALEKPK